MALKVFITGVAGFLGSQLAEDLINSGHTVGGCDNLTTGLTENLPAGLIFHKVDCLDTKRLESVLNGYDVIIHAACLPYEGLSVFSPTNICLNTFQASVSTFTAAINSNVKKIIYCSSMARYGYIENIPFKEEQTPAPLDPYGISKLAAENVLKTLCDTHGANYSILVPHNVIGQKQRFDDPFRNVCAIMINSMLQGIQPVVFGDGLQRRCFTDVRDIVPCFKKVVTSDVGNEQVINIGPDEEFVTILELVKMISEITNFKNLDPVFVPERPSEVKHAYCSSQKSRDLLDYKTNYKLRESLENLTDWIRTVGPKPFNYLLDIEIANAKCPTVWKNKYFEQK